MFQHQFFPDAEFVVVSEELEWIPQPEGVGEGHLFAGFDTRLIQYVGAQNQFAFLFPYEDAEISVGQRYALGGDWADIQEDDADALFGGADPDQVDHNLINVTFNPS